MSTINLKEQCRFNIYIFFFNETCLFIESPFQQNFEALHIVNENCELMTFVLAGQWIKTARFLWITFTFMYFWNFWSFAGMEFQWRDRNLPYLLCFKDEQKSYGFATTWVINFWGVNSRKCPFTNPHMVPYPYYLLSFF